MSSKEMLPGQMSLWQLQPIKDTPRKLTLKFGPNRVSNREILLTGGYLENKDYEYNCHQDKNVTVAVGP